MTADRFGPNPAGEYTALAASRPSHGPVGDSTDLPVLDDTSTRTSTDKVRGGSRANRPAWLPVIPPQHGAWAFLIVPVLVGFAIARANWAGWVFLAALLCAYPVGYYAGRALTARVRRGSWTRLARRELGRAAPWAVLTALLGLPLVLTRPWLLLAAAALAAIWAVGLWVAAHRGERSMANGLILVAQAVAAVPITVAVVAGPQALTDGLGGTTAQATALVAAYLTGSLIHVKSLLREAGNVTYRRLDVAWHAGAAVLAALANPWWLVGFGPALVRAVVARPGMSPAAIGGIEAIVAILVVVAAMIVL